MSIRRFRRTRTNQKFSIANVTILLLGLATLILFGKDVISVIMWVIDSASHRIDFQLNEQVIFSVLTLTFAFMITMLMIFLYQIIFVRRAGMPILNWDEIASRQFGSIRQGLQQRLLHTFLGTYQQMLWFFGFRGINTYIQKGTPKGFQIPRQHSRIIGTVAFDYDSAGVLETRNNHGTIYPPNNIPRSEAESPYTQPLTVGPGLQFIINRGVRGSANLLPITRFEEDVHAFTKDGIEVVANLNVRFTISEIPQILEVAQDKLHPLQQDYYQSDLLHDQTIEINQRRGINLSADDWDDILAHAPDHPDEYGLFQAAPDQSTRNLDLHRIFRAITSETIDAEGNPQSWEELAIQYTRDIFIQAILQHEYEELFGPPKLNDSDYPIQKIKNEIQGVIQTNGMLGYRFLRRRNGRPIQPSIIFPRDQLLSCPNDQQGYLLLPDQPDKVLRARGIKILSVGIRDLHPAETRIHQERVSQWSAPWEELISNYKAEIDYQMEVTIDEKYLEAQKQITANLAKIINHPDRDAALALKLLDSLERMAEDPLTRKQLSKELLLLLDNLKKWMAKND
ncbi:MAG: hypothetical protein JW750_06090 [Anaerolineaceae bacterium]|nr:hypothetical protein [Anaerolineaceae bacterium]